MPTDHKTHIQNIVAQESEQKNIKGNSVLVELSEGGFQVQKFSNASLVNDHFCDVDILVLLCHIKWELAIIIPNVSIASPQ